MTEPEDSTGPESTLRLWLVRAAGHLAGPLARALAEDAQLRALTADLARRLAGEGPAARPEEPTGGGASSTAGKHTPPVPQDVVTSRVTLRLGDTSTPVQVRGASLMPVGVGNGPAGPLTPPPSAPARPETTRPSGPVDRPLAELVRRLRLKAEMCRWQVERRRRYAAGESTAEEDAKRLAVGKEESIYFWIKDEHYWTQDTDMAFETVALAFDLAADATAFFLAVEKADQRTHFLTALKLLAEAQLALRETVVCYTCYNCDEEQTHLFHHVRRMTQEQQIYVEHLKADQRYPPDGLPDLSYRVRKARETFETARSSHDQRAKLWKKFDFHLKKSQDGRHPDEVARVWDVVARLVEAGVPVTNPEFRERLLPLLEDASPDVPPSAVRVIDAVSDWDNARELDEETPADAAKGDPDPVVIQARAYTAGKVAVMICGEPREPHRLRIEKSLSLKELRWKKIEHHQSFDKVIGPSLTTGDVDFVFLVTKLRSHRDGPAARKIARHYGIQVVESTRGYHPNRLADCLVNQTGVKAGRGGD